ncbi:MAG: bile acid:sodium symporter family protein [Spirochaetaceae bacterium]|jgi:BASS family bile acid:Na+ symporter|nr:bile acid:sodium symporter family protein [Spirochaetaceae bacterium]
MKIVEKLGTLAGKYMAIIVVVIAALALFVPSALQWIKTSWINTLLGIVMFGMGLTLKATDFKIVFAQPKNVIAGVLAQFMVMPALAFLLTIAFNLPPELAVGVILVGSAPGGTSSNVMTYLAKGDVALSVCMTAISTLLAPLVTPALILLLAGEKIEVNYISMFLSIIKVVILPIALGVAFTRFFGKITARLTCILPLISLIAIVMIVAAVVAANSARIMTSGMLIALVVICHNLLGYATGYVFAKLCRMNNAQRNTIAIEVGMQNSGLATALAATHYAAMPLAAIPGALFSVWHNISGSIVANVMALRFNARKAREDAAANNP